MQVIHSQDENRWAACAKLAEIAKVLNESLNSVNNKLIRLATDGYDTHQRAVASLAKYQTTGLLCADDVREAEALLRGEPIEDTRAREEERQAKVAEHHARLGLYREGFVEIPGATERARVHSRLIILSLGYMTEDELETLHDDLSERSSPPSKRRQQKVATKRKAAKHRAARTSVPFRLIEGGRGQ